MVKQYDKFEQYFEEVTCPVCGSDKAKELLNVKYADLKQKKSLDYSSIGVTKDSRFYVNKCIDCSMVYVNPRIKNKFENYVYNQCKSPMYLNKKNKFEPGKLEFKIEAIKRKTHYVGALLETIAHAPAKNEVPVLLDYGCGLGHSMELARGFGLDAYGIDIDRQRLNICKHLGLQVSRPDEFDFVFPNVKADIILWQSNIEHVLDPKSIVSSLSEKAASDSVLYVNGLTPEIIEVEKRKGNFVKAHFIEHINYFPIRTLDRLFKEFGWNPVKYTQAKIVGDYKSALKAITTFFVARLTGKAAYNGFFKRIYKLG